MALSRRHRVEALVHEALARAGVAPPAETRAGLGASAYRIALQNLALAAESARLVRSFEAAGIPLLFVKGLTLAVLSYGSISLKMGRDIDILVPPDKVGAAAALLAEAGYRRTLPPPQFDERQLLTWHQHWKESIWEDEPGGMIVELHTALVDNPMLLPTVGIASPRQTVEVAPGITLTTLAREQLFAYLCLHGASSGWHRLKWLADLAAFLAGGSAEENGRLYIRSQELGAGRAAAQALLLCNELLATPIPPPLLDRLRADWRNRLLMRAALRVLTGSGGTKELHETPLGTMPIHLMQFLLLPGWRFRLAELRRQAISPHERIAMPLPRPLHFLYPIIRFPAWLRRKRREREG